MEFTPQTKTSRCEIQVQHMLASVITCTPTKRQNLHEDDVIKDFQVSAT